MRPHRLPSSAAPVPLHLSVDPWWNVVRAIAFGRVDDGLPDDQYVALGDEPRICFVLDEPRGRAAIGFVAREPHVIDVSALESRELWDGPRFDVPALALVRASAGEILLAVQGRFDESEPTAGAMHFHSAIATAGADGDKPADVDTVIGGMRLALEAGEMTAMFGLGYTLVEAGRPREAYDYLRRYTELTPHNAWAWCWLGRACGAMGDLAEARGAYERAVECERAGSFATNAQELLAQLGA